MTDKRVKVPEEAVYFVVAGITMAEDQGTAILGAQRLAQWLTEHPIVPTDEQIQRMRERLHPDMPKGEEWFSADDMARGSILWQRMMFTEPEPEDPLADLVYEHPEVLEQSGVVGLLNHNDCVREAFRRGQQSMIKKEKKP